MDLSRCHRALIALKRVYSKGKYPRLSDTTKSNPTGSNRMIRSKIHSNPDRWKEERPQPPLGVYIDLVLILCDFVSVRVSNNVHVSASA